MEPARHSCPKSRKGGEPSGAPALIALEHGDIGDEEDDQRNASDEGERHVVVEIGGLIFYEKHPLRHGSKWQRKPNARPSPEALSIAHPMVAFSQLIFSHGASSKHCPRRTLDPLLRWSSTQGGRGAGAALVLGGRGALARTTKSFLGGGARWHAL